MATEKNMIDFDSTDWNSIKDTIEKINEAGELQFGTTSEGEQIIFDVCMDEDGYDVLKTTVFQHNGWERTNYYHPMDYTVEELYHKV